MVGLEPTYKPFINILYLKGQTLAEAKGFEPMVALPPHRFSKPEPSTTRPRFLTTPVTVPPKPVEV